MNLDTVLSLIAFEDGNLDDEGTLSLFQDLVNSGLAWNLQESYGTLADRMIQEGLITAPAQ